jgi:hypothetical protein
MLKMVLNVIKPDLVVDVKLIEGYLQRMTLGKVDHDFKRMCDVMLGWQQEINVEKGEISCKDDTWLTYFFKAAKTCKNEKFLRRVEDYYDKWVTGEMTEKSDIVGKLCQLYKNFVASNEWKKGTEKDSKIIALATRVDEVKKKNEALQEQLSKIKKDRSVSFQGDGKKNIPSKGKWLFTYVGSETTDPATGKKFTWCKNHGKGCYMAHPHNHEEWLARKRGASSQGGDGSKKFRREKTDRQGKGGNSAPSKLALSESLKTTLVTQFSMTPSDADKVFEQCYAAAESKDSGNE